MSKIFFIIIIFVNIVPMGLESMHIKINSCAQTCLIAMCVLKEEPSYIMVYTMPSNIVSLG